MSIDSPDLIFIIGAGGAGIGIILLAILIPFLIIMHNLLYRRLDPILFQSPWFNEQQLVMFSAWPLSFIKTVIYMFLIAYPDYIRKKKRFNKLENVPTVEPAIKIACKIYTALHVAFAVIGVSWLLFIFSVYALDNWFS